MKVDIIGAGSLGLLLAGKLIQSGTKVKLWCRNEVQSSALAQKGLTVSFEDGQAQIQLPGDTFEAAPVSQFSGTYLRDPGDWIVVTLKQNAFHSALPALLEPLKNQKLHVVCFQNGYGHLEFLQAILPEASIWAAVTTEAAKRKTLTEVVHAGKGETKIGAYQHQDESAANSLITVLSAAGFVVSVSKEVDTLIYRKLLINAVINPLTAIWRIPNGELPASEERVQLMKELYSEAMRVYAACGITFEENMWETILEVCRATSRNISSMLADVLNWQATEIRWINGSIVAMAEHNGIEVPLHRLVCNLVEGMKLKER